MEFSSGSQTPMLRSVVRFCGKKFLVVIPYTATFRDLKNEISRVYRGIAPQATRVEVAELQGHDGCVLFDDYQVCLLLPDLAEVSAYREGEAVPRPGSTPLLPDAQVHVPVQPAQYRNHWRAHLLGSPGLATSHSTTHANADHELSSLLNTQQVSETSPLIANASTSSLPRHGETSTARDTIAHSSKHPHREYGTTISAKDPTNLSESTNSGRPATDVTAVSGNSIGVQTVSSSRSQSSQGTRITKSLLHSVESEAVQQNQPTIESRVVPAEACSGSDDDEDTLKDFISMPLQLDTSIDIDHTMPVYTSAPNVASTPVNSGAPSTIGSFTQHQATQSNGGERNTEAAGSTENNLAPKQSRPVRSKVDNTPRRSGRNVGRCGADLKEDTASMKNILRALARGSEGRKTYKKKVVRSRKFVSSDDDSDTSRCCSEREKLAVTTPLRNVTPEVSSSAAKGSAANSKKTTQAKARSTYQLRRAITKPNATLVTKDPREALVMSIELKKLRNYDNLSTDSNSLQALSSGTLLENPVPRKVTTQQKSTTAIQPHTSSSSSSIHLTPVSPSQEAETPYQDFSVTLEGTSIAESAPASETTKQASSQHSALVSYSSLQLSPRMGYSNATPSLTVPQIVFYCDVKSLIGSKSNTQSPAAETKPVRKTPAYKTTARKTTARKSTAQKTTAQKTTARKSTAQKTPTRKATPRKSPAKRRPRRVTTLLQPPLSGATDPHTVLPDAVMPQHSVNGEVQTTVLENPPTRFYSYDHINDAELADHLESTPGNGAVTVPQGIPNVQAVVPPATGHSDIVKTARPASLESEEITDDDSALNAAEVALDQHSQRNEPTGMCESEVSCIPETQDLLAEEELSSGTTSPEIPLQAPPPNVQEHSNAEKSSLEDDLTPSSSVNENFERLVSSDVLEDSTVEGQLDQQGSQSDLSQVSDSSNLSTSGGKRKRLERLLAKNRCPNRHLLRKLLGKTRTVSGATSSHTDTERDGLSNKTVKQKKGNMKSKESLKQDQSEMRSSDNFDERNGSKLQQSMSLSVGISDSAPGDAVGLSVGAAEKTQKRALRLSRKKPKTVLYEEIESTSGNFPPPRKSGIEAIDTYSDSQQDLSSERTQSEVLSINKGNNAAEITKLHSETTSNASQNSNATIPTTSEPVEISSVETHPTNAGNSNSPSKDISSVESAESQDLLEGEMTQGDGTSKSIDSDEKVLRSGRRLVSPTPVALQQSTRRKNTTSSLQLIGGEVTMPTAQEKRRKYAVTDSDRKTVTKAVSTRGVSSTKSAAGTPPPLHTKPSSPPLSGIDAPPHLKLTTPDTSESEHTAITSPGKNVSPKIKRLRVTNESKLNDSKVNGDNSSGRYSKSGKHSSATVQTKGMTSSTSESSDSDCTVSNANTSSKLKLSLPSAQIKGTGSLKSDSGAQSVDENSTVSVASTKTKPISSAQSKTKQPTALVKHAMPVATTSISSKAKPLSATNPKRKQSTTLVKPPLHETPVIISSSDSESDTASSTSPVRKKLMFPTPLHSAPQAPSQATPSPSPGQSAAQSPRHSASLRRALHAPRQSGKLTRPNFSKITAAQQVAVKRKIAPSILPAAKRGKVDLEAKSHTTITASNSGNHCSNEESASDSSSSSDDDDSASSTDGGSPVIRANQHKRTRHSLSSLLTKQAPKLASQTRSPSTRGQLPLQHSTPFTSQASQSILTTQPSNRKPLPTSSTGDKPLSLKAFKVPHAMSKSKPAELNLNSLSLSKEEVTLSQNASQNLSSLLDNEELWCDSQHV